MGDIEQKKLLPEGDSKKKIVALKSVSAALTFGEAIFYGFMRATDGGSAQVSAQESSGEAAQRTRGRDAVESLVEFLVSIASFSISAYVGFNCYAPMDISDEMERVAPKYAEKIKKVNSAAHVYTTLWWIKSCLSICADGTRALMYFNLPYKMLESGKIVERAAIGLNTFAYFGALVAECVADVCAGEVSIEDDREYADEDTDKKVFLSDTTGYLFFDAKAIMDSIYSLGVGDVLKGKAKLIYCICREVFAVGCGVSESVATAYINGTLH